MTISPDSMVGIIDQQFDITREYGREAFSLAEKYIDQLNSYIISTISMTPPTVSVPAISSLTLDPVLAEQAPTAIDPADFPAQPSEPTTQDHSFPDQPTFTFPEVPVLTEIVIPSFIDGAITPLSLSIPVMDFDVPATPQIQAGEQVPEDSLTQAIKAKLERNITSGGTMLDPLIEADIWNRDLERNEQALQDAIDNLAGQWAKLGWTLPDGLLAGGFIALQNEYTNKKLDRSREIAVKQAELEQSGMFKSLELGIGFEKILIDSQNLHFQRVLEASKATADVTIAIFRERANRYNVMLEAFKADVAAYKTRVDAEMVRAEIFKAKLTGAQIVASIDETRLKAYSEEVGAIREMVDIYKTRVQSVAMMYEVEKQKIERYKIQVDAYVANVDGVIKKYMASVETFKTYVQAWAASSESQTRLADLSVRAEIATLDATLKEWEIQLKLTQENTALRLEALKAVAQTASNLAAGALSAAHVSGGLSASASDSTSSSYSY